MKFSIERDFIAHGLRCVVLAGSVGHRYGYVGLPKGHPLHGLSYSEGSAALKTAWDRAKEGPIGKRGIITVFLSACAADDELPSADCVFDVHGGLTYSASSKNYPVENDSLWWFGFDCGHWDDAKDESIMDEKHLALERKYGFSRDGTVRTEEYVVAECERLAEQLATFNVEASA